MPPRRTTLDRQLQSGQPIDTDSPHRLLRQPVREHTGEVLDELGAARSMRFHPDRVDDRVGAAAGEQIPDRRGDLLAVLAEVAKIDHLGAMSPRPLQAFGHQIDPDDPLRPEMGGHPARHRTDRPQTEHHHRPAGRHGGVLDRLPRGGQHVGQIEEAVVGGPVGHLDRPVLRLGDSEQLGLRPRHLAVQLRVTEQRRARLVLTDLGGLALGLQAGLTHRAVPARDVEGNHHTVPR